MSKGFDLAHNKHLGNSQDYWKAQQRDSKQIVIQPLQWQPIDRDEDGFATKECLDKMFNNLPCAVCSQTEGGYKYYNMVGEYFDMVHNREDIRMNTGYTYYLPIPKLGV